MQRIFLLVLLSLSLDILAQEYVVSVDTHVFGLFFEEGVPLTTSQKQVIRDDIAIVFKRFANLNYVITPYTVEERGTRPYFGELEFPSAHGLIPWNAGSFVYRVINGTNCLEVSSEICGLYTNAIAFTNEHAAQVQLLPGFIDRYNHAYTNQNMTTEQKLHLLWNPQVLKTGLTAGEVQSIIKQNVPTNSNCMVAYPPAALEFQMLSDNRYTNIPLLTCCSPMKYTGRYETFFTPEVYVFVDGFWRLMLPETP